MSRDFHTVFLVALLTITPGFGQNYRGTYTMTSGDVTLTLTPRSGCCGPDYRESGQYQGHPFPTRGSYHGRGRTGHLCR